MSLSPNNRALVTNMSGGFIVYDLSSARVIACAHDVQGLDQESPAVFSHGGCAVLVGCKDGQAKLFDSESASYLQTLNHEGLPLFPSEVDSNAPSGGGDVRALTVREPNHPSDIMTTLHHVQVHTSEDSDHFLVGTAVVGNTQATIFIWQTVENGASS